MVHWCWKWVWPKQGWHARPHTLNILSACLVLGTWYLILDTLYLILGTWYLVQWYIGVGSGCDQSKAGMPDHTLNIVSACLVLGTWYLILGTWYLILGTMVHWYWKWVWLKKARPHTLNIVSGCCQIKWAASWPRWAEPRPRWAARALICHARRPMGDAHRPFALLFLAAKCNPPAPLQSNIALAIVNAFLCFSQHPTLLVGGQK